MNRKIMLSGLSIMTSLLLTSTAAFAAFTSTNTNTGNTFGVGNMVLKINAQSPTSTGVFAVTGAVPGVSHSAKLTLSNTGSINATSVQVTGINITGSNPELASDVTLVLFNDANNNGVFDGGDTALGTAHLNDGSWTNFVLPGVTVPASGSFNLGAQVTLDSAAPNSDQGKSMTFDLGFQANE